MAKLFISHAANDRPLVEAFVDLLESGVGVPHKAIFCSSLKGQSIKPGEDFVESIREHLSESVCVLSLISEAYYASAFCMCELGGVWVLSKSFLPVIVPPVDHASLKAVLGGLQVSKVAAEDDLDELRDELLKRLDIDGHDTPRWNAKRKKFSAALPDLLDKIKYKGPVPRDKHAKVEKELASYAKAYEERDAELSKLKETIQELKKLKDAKSVAKVVRKNLEESEVFEQLVEDARKALKSLARSVREAMYYRSRRDDYYPEDSDAWEDVKRPLEYGELELTDDEKAVAPNSSSSKVHKAMQAVDALAKWLESDEATEDFASWYDTEYEGEVPDISNRGFWERHLF